MCRLLDVRLCGTLQKRMSVGHQTRLPACAPLPACRSLLRQKVGPRNGLCHDESATVRSRFRHGIVRSADLPSAAAMTGRPAMAHRPAVVSGVRRTFASAVFRIGARRAIGTPVFPALVAAGAVRAVAPAMIAILRATFGRSLGLRLGRFLGTLRHRDRKQRYDKDRNQKQQLFSHRSFSF